MADLFLFPCYYQIMRTVRQRLMPGTSEERQSRKIVRLHKAA
jgi:hypothetical protein